MLGIKNDVIDQIPTRYNIEAPDKLDLKTLAMQP